MSLAEIEQQCELGQRLLMEMEYLKAERVLADAESQAWAGQAWDVLSRLYLPLQEARRQRRQRCGEGMSVWTSRPTLLERSLIRKHWSGRYRMDSYSWRAGERCSLPFVFVRLPMKPGSTSTFLAAQYFTRSKTNLSLQSFRATDQLLRLRRELSPISTKSCRSVP